MAWVTKPKPETPEVFMNLIRGMCLDIGIFTLLPRPPASNELTYINQIVILYIVNNVIEPSLFQMQAAKRVR